MEDNCTWILLEECLNGVDCPRCKKLDDLLREAAEKET